MLEFASQFIWSGGQHIQFAFVEYPEYWVMVLWWQRRSQDSGGSEYPVVMASWYSALKYSSGMALAESSASNFSFLTIF